ncbi:hypothetical protein [Chromobacterium paludis]|uniref:Uncharacterized protein n=1 Tax=Chromobacterium paludis TaxID=2605945 RepID=A0A5C1DGN7_9NEIS|nr:hypothetical protein [Chromobacterium paludis]QEL55910.1 hypothetical protein FYK34_10205 [Chromobacterium paludis]
MQVDSVSALSAWREQVGKPASFAGQGGGEGFASQLAQAGQTPAGGAPTVRPPPFHDGQQTAEDIQWLLPTRETVARHGEYVRQLLAQAMSQAGLPMNPPFQLASTADGEIKLSGQRPDLARIEQLCNTNRELNHAICNLQAIAADVPRMDEAAAYARAWQRAPSDAERMAVFWYYSARMKQPGRVEVTLSGSAAQLVVNGETMPPYRG